MIKMMTRDKMFFKVAKKLEEREKEKSNWVNNRCQ